MRGSEHQFNEIINQLAKNMKNYEAKSISYIKFLDTVDFIFTEYGWSKVDFYAEINARLYPDKPRENPPEPKPKKKPVRKKKA